MMYNTVPRPGGQFAGQRPMQNPAGMQGAPAMPRGVMGGPQRQGSLPLPYGGVPGQPPVGGSGIFDMKRILRDPEGNPCYENVMINESFVLVGVASRVGSRAGPVCVSMQRSRLDSEQCMAIWAQVVG